MFLLAIALSQEMASRVEEAMSFGYRERYSEAYLLVADIMNDYPDAPLPYLMKAALLDYYMEDFGTSSPEKDFYKNLNRAVELATSNIRKGKDPAWQYFYRGSALSFMGMREGRKKNYIAAIQHALSGVEDLKRALELDSSLYDAYLPLGAYDYAISQLPGYLRWLPTIRDIEGRKAKGLDEMKLSMERGTLTPVLSAYTLAWYYYQEGRISESYALSKSLVSRYPESRNFRWIYAAGCRRLGKWAEAEVVYEELLYIVLDRQIEVLPNIALSAYWLSYVKLLRKKYGQVIQYARFTRSVIGEIERKSKFNERMLKNLDDWERRAERKLAKSR